MKKLILTLCALAISLQAMAHPHIWVYTDLALNEQNGNLKSISVKWKFDEMYSAAYMVDADLNGDGVLDDEEAEKMQKQVLEKAVKFLTPFVMLKLGGHDVYGYKFKNLKIRYNEDSEQIEYDFDIVLHAPRSLKGDHTIAILDEEYYVGFEQSYDFAVPNNCNFDLIEDESMTVYEGMVHPEVYKLSCS